jgi:hypothetical protein
VKKREEDEKARLEEERLDKQREEIKEWRKKKNAKMWPERGESSKTGGGSGPGAKHVQTSYSGNSDLGVWISVRPYLLCLRPHLLYARTTVLCNHHTTLNQI